MFINKIVVGELLENCYVVSINNNCIVIDPGDCYEKIKKEIGMKKVLAVLITHYHFDHVGALDKITSIYNVPVIDHNSYKMQNIDKFNFEIIETKGHKEDSVSYYFNHESVMFTGDFLFKNSVGRCDLEGGSYEHMKESLNMIKKYDDNIIIYPGHGEFTILKDEIKNNPYMKGELL